MTERGLWGARLAYPLLAAVLLAAPLLPLNTVPRGFATPDILLAATLAWAARRPAALPVLLVAAVFLLSDFLFQRPPGLHAALVVGATEWLRRRAHRLARGSFLDEWLAVGAAAAAVGLGERLVLFVAATPQAPWGLTVIQLALTAASYPVVALLVGALGVARPGAAGGEDAR